MENKIPLNIKDTNLEILARIAKATSRKYGCNIEIDFQNGHQIVKFEGDESCKPHISEEIEKLFKNSEIH